jgi:hypothetical protein
VTTFFAGLSFYPLVKKFKKDCAPQRAQPEEERGVQVKIYPIIIIPQQKTIAEMTVIKNSNRMYFALSFIFNPLKKLDVSTHSQKTKYGQCYNVSRFYVQLSKGRFHVLSITHDGYNVKLKIN